MTRKKKDFLIGIVVGAVVAAVIAKWHPQNVESMERRLCDGFFVGAVLLLGCGGLRFAGNHGIFDMMGYSLKTVFQTHLPAISIGEARDTPEDFVAYSQRKAEKRKSPAGLLWAGLVYLVLSIGMLVLYYR